MLSKRWMWAAAFGASLLWLVAISPQATWAAGNVNVTADNGEVDVEGDDEDNGIAVTQTGAGIRVAGANGGLGLLFQDPILFIIRVLILDPNASPTTVNNAGSAVQPGAAEDLNIELEDGDDVLLLVRTIAVAEDFNADGGDGNNVLLNNQPFRILIFTLPFTNEAFLDVLGLGGLPPAADEVDFDDF